MFYLNTNIKIWLEFYYINSFANVRMYAKIWFEIESFWSYSKIAKFQTFTMKMKDGNICDLAGSSIK